MADQPGTHRDPDDPAAPAGGVAPGSELARIVTALGRLGEAGLDSDRILAVVEALAGLPVGGPSKADDRDEQSEPTAGTGIIDLVDGEVVVDDDAGHAAATPADEPHTSDPAHLDPDPDAADPADPSGTEGAGTVTSSEDEPRRRTGTLVLPVDATLACELQHWANHLEVPLSELLRVAMRRHLDHLSGVDGSVPAEPHWEA